MCILSPLCEMFVTCLDTWCMLPWFIFAFDVLNWFGLVWLFAYVDDVSLVAWFCCVFRDDFHPVSSGLRQYLSAILAPVVKSLLSCPCLSSAGVSFHAELVHLVCVVVAALFNYATPHKLQGDANNSHKFSSKLGVPQWVQNQTWGSVVFKTSQSWFCCCSLEYIWNR